MATKTASRPKTRKGRASDLEAQPSITVILAEDSHPHIAQVLQRQRLAGIGIRTTIAAVVAELAWGFAQ